MEMAKEAKPRIVQADDAEELAHRALEVFARHADRALRERGRFCVALSGGHTPEHFFELLCDPGCGPELAWDRVHVFWVDERCVPPDAEASNYGLALHTFLSKVDIPEMNVHRIAGESACLEDAVAAYEQTLRSVFELAPGQVPEFDLVVLGMCPDGHVGSLYPNTYALIDNADLVSAVYLMDGDYNRITLTSPVLRAARQVMILVAGAEKAPILRDVLYSEPDEIRYPVHVLWPILNRITWIVDAEAARLL